MAAAVLFVKNMEMLKKLLKSERFCSIIIRIIEEFFDLKIFLGKEIHDG